MFAQERLALFVELVRVLEAFTRLVFLWLLLVVRILVIVFNILLLRVALHRTIEGDIDSALAEVLPAAHFNMSVDPESLEHLLDVLRNIRSKLLLRIKLLLMVHWMLV